MLRRLLLSAAPVSFRRRIATVFSPAAAIVARAAGAGRLPFLYPSPLSPLVAVPRRGLRSRGGRGGAAGAGESKATASAAPSSILPDAQVEEKKEEVLEEEEEEALPTASRKRIGKVKLSQAREQWEQQQREAASYFPSSLDNEEEEEEEEEEEGWMEELDEDEEEDEEAVKMNMLARSLSVEGGREGGRARNLPDRLPQGSGDEGVGFVLAEGGRNGGGGRGRGEEESRKKAALWELVDDRGVQEEEDRCREGGREEGREFDTCINGRVPLTVYDSHLPPSSPSSLPPSLPGRRRVGLTRTSRESVFEAMRQRLQQEEKTAAPSKRQLRLSTGA